MVYELVTCDDVADGIFYVVNLIKFSYEREKAHGTVTVRTRRHLSNKSGARDYWLSG